MIISDQIIGDFIQTRQTTEEICAPLTQEDYVIQLRNYMSPPKWHLGHTSWFFEEFVLKKYDKNYQEFNSDFKNIFNSAYQHIEDCEVRSNRGNLSRPSVEEVYEYRDHITNYLAEFLDDHLDQELSFILTLGIQHEKQHQELLITDIKYLLGSNPLLPRYSETYEENIIEKQKNKWIKIKEGVYEIGHATTDFCFDNELGKHKVYLNNYKISNKLVTNGEYLEFILDGGYENDNLWHAEGWQWLKRHQIKTPKYWHIIAGQWQQYTLKGIRLLDLEAPVTHVSYYEAFAYATWRELRLPTEFEWEVAQDFFDWGKRWEWTESAYQPYPKFKKRTDFIWEYNQNFMVNKKVLRGGSVVTSKNHTRYTYRNFYHPSQRWQFNGIRLAKG